ncbi:hypothetical protein HMSSN139_07030 [Paenibacillus sp. HMSSN-139]|nr:hypothetical protein HMSSN139_07030 [Paenibacillus sp. HMSSN-139]
MGLTRRTPGSFFRLSLLGGCCWQIVVWQFIASTTKQDIDFGGASLNKFISGLDEVPARVVDLIEQKIDYMDAAFRNWNKEKRKMLKKSSCEQLVSGRRLCLRKALVGGSIWGMGKIVFD